MKNEFICVVCPNGCKITVTGTGEAMVFSGALCGKGEEYAKQEMVDPRRTIATLVRVENGSQDTVSVRLTRSVPLARIPDVMKVARSLSLAAPVSRGAVVAPGVLGLESDLIATDDVSRDETR